MSLSSALSIAMAGLRANQAGLSIVSSNVANSKTPGYVTQTLNQVEIATGSSGSSVRTTGINRQLDQYVQTQLRTETSGSAYATQLSNVLGQLQTAYGTPGSAGTLETTFSNFTTALQSITTSPTSLSAQSAALTAAQSLAQQLNATSRDIQSLRSNVEQDIGTSVGQANSALTQIANINTRLQSLDPNDPAAATLLDQRDTAINQLSQLIDIRVVNDSANQTSIYTNSGIQLLGAQASQLSLSSSGTLSATSLWNVDPAKSGVGALTIGLPNGSRIDLVSSNSIGSGRIAADLQLRDNVLVQAQAQVDQLAASLATSLSDKTTGGAAVTSAGKAGFDIDLSGVQPGNTVNFSYTDQANVTHKISIVRVDDAAALPLSNTATLDPADTVLGVNFSGGLSSVVSQLNAAFGSSNLQFSNTAGSTLRVLDDGSGAVSLTAGSATTTALPTALADGSPQLAVFTDGNASYTGAITALGSQKTGLAGRITVNPNLVADVSKIRVYGTSPATLAGDTTRSDFLYSQLTTGTFSYASDTGLGSTASPFKGTLTSYMQQFLSLQSNTASNATQLQQGQQVVVNTLQEKFNATSGVNIDTELSNLIALQNTYSANAKVMSVVQSLMATLMQIQT